MSPPGTVRCIQSSVAILNQALCTVLISRQQSATIPGSLMADELQAKMESVGRMHTDVRIRIAYNSGEAAVARV